MGRRRLQNRVIRHWGPGFAALLALLLVPPALAGAEPPAPDDPMWSGVEAHEFVVFPPGQSSWEWDLTESDHSGGPKVRKGKTCASCHLGEEAKMGALLSSGKKIEPDPIGARPSIPVQVKAVHDGGNLLVRLEWPDVSKHTSKPMDPNRDAQVAVMLGDDSDKAFKIAGCWATCHDDAKAMPSAAEGSDLTKYLGVSRTKLTRHGGDEHYKSAAELASLMKEGNYIEYWRASLRGSGLSGVHDGVILKERKDNASTLVEAAAERKGGRWVVTLSRPLAPGKDGHHDIVAGRTYTIGIAVHDDHSEGRHHHVSFERSLALDSGDADVVVKAR